MHLFCLTGYLQLCCIVYFANITTESTILSSFWWAIFLALWRLQTTLKRTQWTPFYSYYEHGNNTAYFICTIVILFTGNLHQKKENKSIFHCPEVNNFTVLKSASNSDICAWFTASIRRLCWVFFPFLLTPQKMMHIVKDYCLIKPQLQEKPPTIAMLNKAMIIKIVLSPTLKISHDRGLSTLES